MINLHFKVLEEQCGDFHKLPTFSKLENMWFLIFFELLSILPIKFLADLLSHIKIVYEPSLCEASPWYMLVSPVLLWASTILGVIWKFVMGPFKYLKIHPLLPYSLHTLQNQPLLVSEKKRKGNIFSNFFRDWLSSKSDFPLISLWLASQLLQLFLLLSTELSTILCVLSMIESQVSYSLYLFYS